MAIYHRFKNRAKLSPRIRRESRQHLLQKLVVFAILVAISLGLLVFDRSIFLSSNNLALKERERAEPLKLVPAWFDKSQESSNSRVGHPLNQQERQAIAQILGQPLSTDPDPAFDRIPKFILHDTSGELSDSTIERMKQQARGPMGNGIAAYVSREGKVTIARSMFFNQRRPTATVYEKAADILPETVRNREIRRVWSATAASIRQAALKNVVAELNLNEPSLANRASIWLNAPSEQAFETLKARSSTNLDGGKTTGLWTVAQICNGVLNDSENAARMASSSGTAATLKNACQKLNPVLSENRKRVASSTHVEILQKRGSECWVTNAQVRAYNQNVPDSLKIQANRVVPLETLDRPAYTDEQYEQIARLYLQAALQAGQFPEITTHYWVDQGEFGRIGTHCDPRGFDLMRLYRQISLALGHPQKTRYGIEPQYGIHPEKGDNVWWTEAVLEKLPPDSDSI